MKVHAYLNKRAMLTLKDAMQPFKSSSTKTKAQLSTTSISESLIFPCYLKEQSLQQVTFDACILIVRIIIMFSNFGT